jgi:hypothetical protein
MELLTLIIALVALVVALMAYVRTGGIARLHQQTAEMRSRTANLLERFEHVVRPEEDDEEERGPDDFSQSRTAKKRRTPQASV